MASTSRYRDDSRLEGLKETNISLPLLKDRRTEMYVKFAKVMIIFQGPESDSRKGLVTELETKFKYSCRIVSDKTFRKETNSTLIPENTKDFHLYFRSRTKQACEEGYNLIVIDQSISNSDQIRYYFFLAQTFQYVILPVPALVTEKKSEAKQTGTMASSFKKDTTLKFHNLFAHKFCGWFLHDVDSAELREEGSLYARDCFDIPEFDEMFSQTCKPHSFKNHYNMVNIRQDIAYCVVKVLKTPTDVSEYISQEAFRSYYGKMNKLYIVGFIISPHIIAARVKLTFDQKKLWNMPDDLPENANPDIYPSEILKSTKVRIPNEKVSLLASKSNRTVITGSTINQPLEAIPSNSRGRSCHILLGKVDDAPKQSIDYDVPFAVCRERRVVSNPDYADSVRPFDLDRCLVRRIGKYWFVYLKETIIVNGFFATCCTAESNIA